MKKITAILLIIVFLFNIGGYRLWLGYIQTQSSNSLEASLDRNEFNENELIKIIIPLSNAYQSDWSSFQRVNGEITVGPRIYKYVKQKVQDGNLILLCVPDYNKIQVESIKNDLVKNTLDLASNNTQKQSRGKIFNKTIEDFICTEIITSKNFSSTNSDLTILNCLSNIGTIPHHSPEQPPEFFDC